VARRIVLNYRLTRRVLPLALAAMAFASCGANESQALADGACATTGMSVARVYGNVTAVSGAFRVNASELADWQETRHGPDGPSERSPWRGKPATTPVTVCFYDGDFPNFPGGPGPTPVKYDRLVVIVPGDESPSMYVVGNHATLSVERPHRK
jgi:hypothetical protein